MLYFLPLLRYYALWCNRNTDLIGYYRPLVALLCHSVGLTLILCHCPFVALMCHGVR